MRAAAQFELGDGLLLLERVDPRLERADLRLRSLEGIRLELEESAHSLVESPAARAIGQGDDLHRSLSQQN